MKDIKLKYSEILMIFDSIIIKYEAGGFTERVIKLKIYENLFFNLKIKEISLLMSRDYLFLHTISIILKRNL